MRQTNVPRKYALLQSAAAGIGDPVSNDGSGAKSGALVAQNTAQHSSARDRTDSRDDAKPTCFACLSHTSANEGEGVQTGKVGHTGLEPVTSCVSCKRASQLRQWPITGAAV